MLQSKGLDRQPYQMAQKESNGVAHTKDEDKLREEEEDEDEQATVQPTCNILQETAL